MSVHIAPLIGALPAPRLQAELARQVRAPLGFVRGINEAADRERSIAQLLRPLAPEDDHRLRIVDDAAESWVLAERLPWDSEFFGYGVARLHGCLGIGGTVSDRQRQAALELLCARLHDAGIRYVICQVEATALAAVRDLCALGFTLIETRCHYWTALDEVALGHPRHPTRLATAADVPSLARAARLTVNPYDRFHADPFIALADADRLMERWVEASIKHGFADATMVPDVAEPEAFCTLRYHRAQWPAWGLRLAQTALTAVAPSHRGWHQKLVTEIHQHLHEIGADHHYLTTQITNLAVIRSLEKLRYRFGRAEHTFRRVL